MTAARLPIRVLLEKRVVLLDGAMGSALIARGLPMGACPELWNLERPDEVLAVHASHIAAGSDVVQTNSFGGNPFALASQGLDDRFEEVNVAAARLARAAAGAGRLVAGNLGPSGKMLAPLGDADPAALEDNFARQAGVLAEAGVDYLSVETMMDLAEALCALRGARKVTGLSVTVTMTFERKPRGYFTLMGDRPEECMRALVDEGASGVGANCSLGSGDMRSLVPLLRDGCGAVPPFVKPNAGLPNVVDGRAVYRQEPAEFAADLAEAVRLGARAVGGCCGTDARHIAALRTVLGRP